MSGAEVSVPRVRSVFVIKLALGDDVQARGLKSIQQVNQIQGRQSVGTGKLIDDG
jgi:hypothetical protein